MKKKAFFCSSCGTLNIPFALDKWQGFVACRECGSLERVATMREIRTKPKLYHTLSREFGLPIPALFELQKRGLLPRDLATCTSAHRSAVGAVKLALGSEEILRVALASLPKNRRERLLHPVASDGLLTQWQRYILDHYVSQYRMEKDDNPSSNDKRTQYGSTVTRLSAMIRLLESEYGLPAATSRPWIKKLRKVAYNRVRRECAADGGLENG